MRITIDVRVSEDDMKTILDLCRRKQTGIDRVLEDMIHDECESLRLPGEIDEYVQRDSV